MKERNPSTKLCVDFPVMPVLDHRSRFGCSAVSAGYGDTAGSASRGSEEKAACFASTAQFSRTTTVGCSGSCWMEMSFLIGKEITPFD